MLATLLCFNDNKKNIRMYKSNKYNMIESYLIIVPLRQISNHDARLAQLQFGKERDKNKSNERIRKKGKKQEKENI